MVKTSTSRIRGQARKKIESLVNVAFKAAGISKTKTKTIGKRVLRLADTEQKRVRSAVKQEAKREVKRALTASKKEVKRLRSELKKARKTSRRRR